MTAFNYNELKPNVSLMLEQRGYEFFPGKNRFAEVYLPVDGESIPPQALPKADFAAKQKDTYLFIEVDKDQGAPHNVAKYFYILDRLRTKPNRVLLLHLLGSGFLASENNYVFHRKLADFLSKKIKSAFEKQFEFTYNPSEAMDSNEEMLTWLSKNLP